MSAAHVSRDAQHVVGGRDTVAVCVEQSLLNEVNGDVCDVYADPAPLEFDRSVNRGSATAEGVQDYVTLTAARRDDALKQFYRLLCRVAQPLARLRVQG